MFLEFLQRFRFCILVTFVLFIGGCLSVGPDYEDQGTEVLQAWETDLYGQMGTVEDQADLDL